MSLLDINWLEMRWMKIDPNMWYQGHGFELHERHIEVQQGRFYVHELGHLNYSDRMPKKKVQLMLTLTGHR